MRDRNRLTEAAVSLLRQEDLQVESLVEIIHAAEECAGSDKLHKEVNTLRGCQPETIEEGMFYSTVIRMEFPEGAVKRAKRTSYELLKRVAEQNSKEEPDEELSKRKGYIIERADGHRTYLLENLRGVYPVSWESLEPDIGGGRGVTVCTLAEAESSHFPATEPGIHYGEREKCHYVVIDKRVGSKREARKYENDPFVHITVGNEQKMKFDDLWDATRLSVEDVREGLDLLAQETGDSYIVSWSVSDIPQETTHVPYAKVRRLTIPPKQPPVEEPADLDEAVGQ